MTERTVAGEQIKALRLYMPKSVVIKFNDQSTAGIPDINVQWGRSTWLELKLLKPGDSFQRCSDPVQQVTMRQLRHAGARAWYVIFDMRQEQRTTTVYDAPVFSAPEPDRHLIHHVSGFDYAEVARLVRNVHEHDSLDVSWLEEL